MKRSYTSVMMAIILLASCNNSPIDKANALIKDDMLKKLVIAESYEPVETKVDSAFAPFDAPEFYIQTLELLKMGAEMQEYEEKAKHAKSSMTIWSNPYSAYSKNQYQESKTEYEEYIEKQKTLQAHIENAINELKGMIRQKPRFIGFKAIHRYRAKNNAGQTLLVDELYILNKDLTEIIASYDMASEDYGAFQEAVNQLMDGTEPRPH